MYYRFIGIVIGLVKPVFLVTEGLLASVCAVIRDGTIARPVGFIIESLPNGTASCKLSSMHVVTIHMFTFYFIFPSDSLPHSMCVYTLR